MNAKTSLSRQFCRRIFITAILSLTLVAQLSRAENHRHYLKHGKPNPLELLAPPPLPGSLEQAADLATVVNANKNCPDSDKALALSEKKIFVFNFAPAIGTFFKSNSLPKTAAFFQRLHEDTGIVVDAGKEHWERPRPFLADTNIIVYGETETTFSYPSGHSTKAIVFAEVLSEIFPEKRAEIFGIGRDIGWHRVQLARHYPTDVQAGRVLGQAIAREMKKNSAFKRDLAAVKAELLAAKNGTKTSPRPAAPNSPSAPSAGDGAKRLGNLKNF